MKKTVFLIFTLSIFQVPVLLSQSFLDIINAATVEDLDEICTNTLGFTSTPVEIENAISDIVNTAGITTISFKLKECSNINNVIAKIITENGEKKRYIIYDAEWLKKMVNNTFNDWKGKFILAHEIGHHLNAHTLDNNGSTVEVELEANYFAGRALASLGVSEVSTSTHPARADRIASAKQGWTSLTHNNTKVEVKKEKKRLIIHN